MTVTVAVTVTGDPCPLGFPSLQGGVAASWLTGCHHQGCFSTILCIPFFLFGTEEPKEPQHGGVNALVKTRDLPSCGCAQTWVCTNLGVHKLAYSSYPCVFLSAILRILTLFLLLFVWGLTGAAPQGGRKHLMQLATRSSSPV